jgi:hypothetical protein
LAASTERCSLTVMATTADGKAFPEAYGLNEVVLYDTRGDKVVNFNATLASGAQELFEKEGLLPGVYDVVLNHVGKDAYRIPVVRSVRLEPGARTLPIVLHPGTGVEEMNRASQDPGLARQAWLEVRVTTEDGSVVPEAYGLNTIKVRVRGQDVASFAAFVYANSEEWFSNHNLPPGSYEILIDHVGGDKYMKPRCTNVSLMTGRRNIMRVALKTGSGIDEIDQPRMEYSEFDVSR